MRVESSSLMLALVGLLVIPLSSFAWNSCPLEKVNCTTECAAFVDTDGDGICDHSQPAPENRNNNLPQTKDHDHDSDHEHEYSVEIPGRELKAMKIVDIARLWGIDAEILLSQIIGDIELQGQYTAISRLDDLRAEKHFAPSQVKAIAEAIKSR